MRVPFGLWVAAGVAAGALGCTALVAAGVLDVHHGSDGSTDLAEPAAQDAAARTHDAEAFVSAYERSRLGTYVVTSTFRRTLADGGRFTSESTVAQRPPDRLERSLGSATSRQGRRITLCRPTAGGVYRCDEGRARRSYRDEVAQDVDTVRTYVEGDLPLYRVRVDGDCFDLHQVRPLPAPPYGTDARFCFDPDTAAPTSTRVVREQGTDLTEATEVRADVTSADLRPPSDGDPAPPPLGPQGH